MACIEVLKQGMHGVAVRVSHRCSVNQPSPPQIVLRVHIAWFTVVIPLLEVKLLLFYRKDP